MRHRTMLGAVLVAAISACKPDLPARLEPGQVVTLRGEIVAGVECPMLLAASGRRFSLAGNLGRFQPGDRVCVQGTIAGFSICMAGEATISMNAIAPEDSCR